MMANDGFELIGPVAEGGGCIPSNVPRRAKNEKWAGRSFECSTNLCCHGRQGSANLVARYHVVTMSVPLPIHGRGAADNPANRFEPVEFVVDGDWLDLPPEERPS